jgi:hypothetical protein
MRSVLPPSLALLLAFAWLGCGESVASVAVTPTQARIVVADTVRLSASALAGDGSVLTNEAITWASGNEAVATVDASGLVTGKANGVVDISATAGGVSGAAAISVFTPSVLVLSNDAEGNAVIADSFPAHQAHLTFDTLDVGSQTPSVALLSQYDVVLLYEDGSFANAPNVGDSVGAYVAAGGNVVLGTFYWQDRSDNTQYNAHGWGLLETLDPFTAPYGSEYRPDSLDVTSIVAHPITVGVSRLVVDQYHGGVAAKTGTTVLARWSDACQACTAGVNDPAVGYRIGSSGQRIVGISVAPHYPAVGGYSGDFYQLWGNALRWAAAGGPGPSMARSAGAVVWRVGQAATPAVRSVAGGSGSRRVQR